MTQKEIAELLGISPATVSLVLNKPNVKISDELKEKIWDLYRRNSKKYFQQQSRQVGDGNIGYVIHSDQVWDVDFFAKVLSGIEDGAGKYNLNLLIYDLKYKSLEECKNLDGLLFHGRIPRDQQREIGRYMPTVTLDFGDSNDYHDVVITDNRTPVVNAVNLLTNLGHERIAFYRSAISDECQMSKPQQARYYAYLEGLLENGLELDKSLVLNDGEEIDTRFDHWFSGKNPVTAVICTDDLYALQIMQNLSYRGLVIPDDVSVIGFGDIRLCSAVTPPLTSIACNRWEMGRIGVDMLMNRIQYSNKRSGLSVILDCSIIERESVGPPPAKQETGKKRKAEVLGGS